MDRPAKPPSAVAIVLAVLAFAKLLSTARDAFGAVWQSLAGRHVPFLLAVACDDLQRSLYGFIMLLGAAVLAQQLDRIRWTLAGDAGPLERTYLATWLAGALRRVRTFAQADVEAKP
jgi:hypothetical protein